MKKKLFLGISLVLSGIFISSNFALAQRHIHKEDTKDVTFNQTINESNTQNRHIFYDKIQSIIKSYEKKYQEEPVTIKPNAIMGPAVATPEQCVRYLLENNPNPDISVTAHQLVSYYYEEGKREGVRPDVAFAQALVETGYFRYGGTVSPDQNNYCGLGTTSSIIKGAYFPNSLLGVRAHIQHLLAYASLKMPKEPIVDPRYELVRSTYGEKTLDTWQQLNGRWAVPGKTYGQNILRVYEAILHTPK